VIDINYTNIIWGPYVSKMKMEKHVIDRLLESGNELKKDDRKNNFNKALAGNLDNQYKFNEETVNYFYKEFVPYFKAYRYGHCQHFDIQFHDVSAKSESLWINYMKSGEFNPPHIHTSDLSFVLFLDVPEQIKMERKQFEGTASGPGDLIFNHGEYNQPTWTKNTNVHYPENGDLIIFPALLQHHVHPFKSKGVERVSISGNLNYIKDETWPNDYF
jgi:hypothetical protein